MAETLILMYFWLTFSLAVAILARRYRRTAIGWFIFAIFLSPVLAAFFVLALGPKAHKKAI